MLSKAGISLSAGSQQDLIGAFSLLLKGEKWHRLRGDMNTVYEIRRTLCNTIVSDDHIRKSLHPACIGHHIKVDDMPARIYARVLRDRIHKFIPKTSNIWWQKMFPYRIVTKIVTDFARSARATNLMLRITVDGWANSRIILGSWQQSDLAKFVNFSRGHAPEENP